VCTLKIGQKIICIKKDGWIDHNLENGQITKAKHTPDYNKVYTIKEIFKMSDIQLKNSKLDDPYCFTLDEFGDSCIFTARRFEDIK
jgi:hypothetical protein